MRAESELNTAYVPRWVGALTMTGALGFVVVVGALHVLQPGYAPAHQLMSELALGAYGWAMLAAFLFIAVSTLSVALGVGQRLAAACVVIWLCFAGIRLRGACCPSDSTNANPKHHHD